MNRIKDGIVLFIAQGAWSGRFPFAPGTAGSAVAVPLYLAIRPLSPLAYLGVCVLVVLIGTWAADRAETLLGKKDASSIVIDEIAGYFLSMFLIPSGWGYVIAGFVLFRIFDVIKPYPLRRLQDAHGGIGVMLDDIGAAVYTNFVLQIASFATY